jgi:hypothetical protein
VSAPAFRQRAAEDFHGQPSASRASDTEMALLRLALMLAFVGVLLVVVMLVQRL